MEMGEVDNGNELQYKQDLPKDSDIAEISSSFASLGLRNPGVTGKFSTQN